MVGIILYIYIYIYACYNITFIETIYDILDFDLSNEYNIYFTMMCYVFLLLFCVHVCDKL